MITKVPRPKGKRQNVVSIEQPAPVLPDEPLLVASDPDSHRYVIAIGGERIAYDVTTRITRLAPTTGNQPAPVLPMTNSAGKKTKRNKDKVPDTTPRTNFSQRSRGGGPMKGPPPRDCA